MNTLPLDRASRSTVSITVRDEPIDPAWDGFLATVPSGHHTQSAAWGRLKTFDGWRPVRVIAETNGSPVAGAQVLVRRLPRLGAVGYIPRGPVVDPSHPDAIGPVLDAVRELARGERLRAVLAEPDSVSSPSSDSLTDHGFVAARRRLTLGATVVVDVSPPPDQILAGLRSKARYNIRLAAKRGVRVRSGEEADLSTFERLMADTARRQGFDPGPAQQYRRWFEVLAADRLVRLFVAEVDEVPVAAILVIALGDSVIYKRGAWSGEHGDRRPNEALHWAAMEWAHHNGHRWYDFDGIDTEPARRALAGEPLPDKWANASVTRFKLSFGGQVVLLPDSMLLLRHRLSRWTYAKAGAPLVQSKTARKALRRLQRQ